METPETLAATVALYAPGLSILVLLAGGLSLGAVRSGHSLLARWHEGIARLRQCPVSPGDAELLLVLLLLPHLLGGIAALTHAPGAITPGTPPPDGPQLLLGAAMLQACLLFGIAMVWMRHPADRAGLFNLPQLHPAQDLLHGIILLFRTYPYLMLISALVLLLHRVGLPTAPQDAVRLLRAAETPAWARWGLIATAILTAPILEEIVFRGILLPACLRHRTPWVAIALISLLFAAAHLNATSLLPLVCLGALLCIAYIRSGSLLVPIAMHTTYNAIQILLIMQIPIPTT